MPISTIATIAGQQVFNTATEAALLKYQVQHLRQQYQHCLHITPFDNYYLAQAPHLTPQQIIEALGLEDYSHEIVIGEFDEVIGVAFLESEPLENYQGARCRW